MHIALRTSLLKASPTQPQKTKSSESSTWVSGMLMFAHDPLINLVVEKSTIMGEGVDTQSGETNRSILSQQKWLFSTNEIMHKKWLKEQQSKKILWKKPYEKP